MEYREVTVTDAPFLYGMLKERDLNTGISHKEMPLFEQHCEFILSKPYKEWKLVLSNTIPIGNYYLTDRNEIGLFILKNFQNKGIGSKVLSDIMNEPGRYLANISPNNVDSQRFFERHGFNKIQHTLECEI